MSSLRLAKGLSLPLEIGTQAMTILGLRGSGKTNTGGVLVEELLKAGQPMVVIDPLDAWWGLCSSIDGKRAGYPVLVFGGPHGQLPLEETSGKTIAQFIVEEQVPVILSMRHLRKGAQRRLVTDLCEELYHLKGKPQYRQPLTVVIDEAPLFIPQKATNDMARCVGAIEDLAARGRSSGFGVLVISQRSATITKDVLSQSGIIIAHRLTAPQDKKALKDWFEENADVAKLHEILTSLAELKDGEAWVWAPRFSIFEKVQVRLRETFDSSATPKAGAKVIAPKNIAQVDLESLKGRMAASIEKAKLEDPTTLQKRIKELEKQLSAQSAPTTQGKPVKETVEKIVEKRVEISVLKEDHVKRLEAALDGASERIFKPLAELQALIGKHKATPVPPPAKISQKISQPVSAVRSPVVRATPAGEDTGEALSPGETAILRTVIQFGETAREELTVITGYKKSSRDTYIQRLSAKGLLVTQAGGYVEATEAGHARIPDAGPLPTGSELVAFWRPRLSPGEEVLLNALLANPSGLTSERLSEMTEYKKSSRDTYLQRMSAKRLVLREHGLIKPNPQLLD
jgi:hypothetical protein